MQMKSPTLALAVLLCGGAAHAASVNLNTWNAESYDQATANASGVWTVAPGGASVVQSRNGDPTLFYSDFSAFGTQITGTIRPGGSTDDDFIGFALGFQPGDTTNAAADYLLIDWKQHTQSWDFPAPSTSDGGSGAIGLAVSRVTGVPDGDEFWQHANLDGTVVGSGVQELARGTTLGSSGWAEDTDYEFTFDFGPNDLEVFVDGVKEIDITGSFSDGRMAFYNFSQANVTYSAFELNSGSFTAPIPEPSTYALMLAGLGLVAFVAKRRRKITAAE